MGVHQVPAQFLASAACDLADVLEARRKLERNFHGRAQENLIRYLYLNAILRKKPGLADRVWVDFPLKREDRVGGTREKLDIVLWTPKKTIIECKYVRSDQACTGTRGSLIHDVARLFDPEGQADRFFLLVASDRFCRYLAKGVGFPLNKQPWNGTIASLARRRSERDWLEEWPGITVEVPASLQLIAHQERAGWHTVLWEVN
jgi:hypothetical protein